MKTVITIICIALLIFTGCAVNPTRKSTHPQPGQRALIVFKITHQDRAGESGTAIRKTGEIVAIKHGDVVIAGNQGDILHCPPHALHAVTPEIAPLLTTRKQRPPDFVAAEELERWFPAQTVPFTLRWLSSEEISKVIRQSKPNP